MFGGPLRLGALGPGPPDPLVKTALLMPVTTNGDESYHGHLNADFNSRYPNIYIFVEALLHQQAATCTVKVADNSKIHTSKILLLTQTFYIFCWSPDDIRLLSTCLLFCAVIVVCRLYAGSLYATVCCFSFYSICAFMSTDLRFCRVFVCIFTCN